MKWNVWCASVWTTQWLFMTDLHFCTQHEYSRWHIHVSIFSTWWLLHLETDVFILLEISLSQFNFLSLTIFEVQIPWLRCSSTGTAGAELDTHWIYIYWLSDQLHANCTNFIAWSHDSLNPISRSLPYLSTS